MALGIIVLGFVLRLYHLDAQELRGDEAFGYFFSLHGYLEIIRDTINLQEPHPVASYFLQHVWLQLAGHSVFALRFSSAWFNLLAVALLYRIARSMRWQPATALWAALLLALSPYALWHGQDARMYSMSMALTIATVWTAIEWLQRQRMQYAVAYVVCATLALYTHYYSAYVLLALYVYVLSLALYDPRFQNSVISLLSPLFFIVLLYSPWYERIASVLQSYHGNGDSPGFVEMLLRAFSTFEIGQVTSLTERQVWAWVLLAALGGSLFLLAFRNKAQWRSVWLLLLYLFVPLLVTWFGSFNRPIFNERYLVTALPPLLLLVAAGQNRLIDAWQTLRRQYIALPTGSVWSALVLSWFVHSLLILCVAAGMLLGLNRLYFDSGLSKTRGWSDLALQMNRFAAGIPPAQTTLVQISPEPTLWYYTGNARPTIALPPHPFDLAGAEQEVKKLVQQGVKRVVLAAQPDPNWDDQEIAQTALRGAFSLVAEQPVHDWTLQVFDALPETLTPIDVAYINQLKLDGFATQPSGLSPGGVLTVYVHWNLAEAQLTGQEKVSLQLLDGQGQLVAQDDRPLWLPANPALPCTYGILLPDWLPADEYRLMLVLYDPEKQDAQRILSLDGADAVHLTSLSAE